MKYSETVNITTGARKERLTFPRRRMMRHGIDIAHLEEQNSKRWEAMLIHSWYLPAFNATVQWLSLIDASSIVRRSPRPPVCPELSLPSSLRARILCEMVQVARPRRRARSPMRQMKRSAQTESTLDQNPFSRNKPRSFVGIAQRRLPNP